MKKLLLIGLFLTVVVAGCGQKSGLTESELFDKKQECANLKDKIEKDLSTRFPDGVLNETLYVSEIFYSQKLNSCLYGGESIVDDIHEHIIVDYLNNKKIYSTIPGCRFDTSKGTETTLQISDRCFNEYKLKIIELKGE